MVVRVLPASSSSATAPKKKKLTAGAVLKLRRKPAKTLSDVPAPAAGKKKPRQPKKYRPALQHDGNAVAAAAAAVDAGGSSEEEKKEKNRNSVRRSYYRKLVSVPALARVCMELSFTPSLVSNCLQILTVHGVFSLSFFSLLRRHETGDARGATRACRRPAAAVQRDAAVLGAALPPRRRRQVGAATALHGALPAAGRALVREPAAAGHVRRAREERVPPPTAL